MSTNSKEYMQKYRDEKKEIVSRARKKWKDKNKEHHKLYMREYRARKKAEKLELDNKKTP